MSLDTRKPGNLPASTSLPLQSESRTPTGVETDYMKLLIVSHRTPFSPGSVPRGPIAALVTDYSRKLSVLEADCGYGLGSPLAYREPYLGRDRPAREVTIRPRCKNNDLEILIGAERVVLDGLKQNVDTGKRSEFVFG